jgi:hypothetical protein|tara:strand:+ start:1742 stop:1945 length:204 start_codon:yes stop_codon:yes gene_type:complete
MTPPDRIPPRANPPHIRKSLSLPAGIGAGLVLWLIISLSTGNAVLGLLFGFLPGLVIGIGLRATARR